MIDNLKRRLAELDKKRKKEYATDVLKREIEERKRTKESYNLTPSEIRFITERLEELIEEWDVPDMVFTAHEILKKLEMQQ